MNKPMVGGFYSVGSWCYSGWWGNLRTLVEKCNFSRVIPRLHGWVYKNLKGSAY